MTDEAVIDEIAEQPELTDEQKRAKRRGLAQAAIGLATQGRWEDALAVNTEILEMFPDDPEASNRIGNAFMQLNRVDEAVEAYERTLASQPTNVIAQRNLTRLQRLAEAGESAATAAQKLPPAFFVEEVGRTGITQLVDLDQEAALRATAGEEVNLKDFRGSIKIMLLDGSTVGKVEPDLAERLTRLMKTGNKYQAGVVMADLNRVRILIRETQKSQANEGKISFPPKAVDVRAYTREGMIRRDDEDEESESSEAEADEVDDEDENPSEFGFSETTLNDETDIA